MTIVLCIEEIEGDYEERKSSNIDNTMFFLYDSNKSMFDIYVKRGNNNIIREPYYKAYSLSLKPKDIRNFIEAITDNSESNSIFRKNLTKKPNTLSFILFNCDIKEEVEDIDFNDSEYIFELLNDGYSENIKYNMVAYDNMRLTSEQDVNKLYSLLEVLKRQY